MYELLLLVVPVVLLAKLLTMYLIWRRVKPLDKDEPSDHKPTQPKPHERDVMMAWAWL